MRLRAVLLTVGSWNLSTRGLGPNGRVFEGVVCGWPFAKVAVPWTCMVSRRHGGEDVTRCDTASHRLFVSRARKEYADGRQLASLGTVNEERMGAWQAGVVCPRMGDFRAGRLFLATAGDLGGDRLPFDVTLGCQWS